MAQSTVPRSPGPRETGGSPPPPKQRGSGLITPRKKSRVGRRRRRDDPRLKGGITFRHKVRRDYPLILMTVPVVVLLLVFAYIPIAAN
ncbi:sugar ABC transporter permease, partial [Streptomyces sp. 6N223]